MTDPKEAVFGNGNPEGTPPQPVVEPDEPVDSIVQLLEEPEEIPVAPGTPVADPVAPEADPQKAETEKFYQTKYQELMSTLNDGGTAPELGQPIITPPVAPVIPEVPADPAQPEDDIYLAQINKRFDQLEQQRVAQQQAATQGQYNQEYAQASNLLDQFAIDSGATQEQINKAAQSAKEMGITLERIGGPTATVKYIAQYLDHQRLRTGPTPQEVTTLAAAEQKVLTDKMVAQPNVATPGQPAVKTREQKILDVMESAGSNQATKDVFG